MIRQRLNNWLAGSHWVGLEITQLNGELRFSALKVRRKSGELQIQEERAAQDLKGIASHISQNYPVYLILNTDAVLTKLFTKPAAGHPDDWLHQQFPNLNIAEFYYQVVACGRNCMVSVARKDAVTNWLNEAYALKIQVAGLQIGPGSIAPLLPYLPEGDLHVAGYTFQISEGAPTHVQRCPTLNETALEINGLAVKLDSILGFGAILGNLTGSTSTSNFSDLNGRLRADTKSLRWLRITSRAAIVFFLILLLSNFLLFSHYYAKADEYRATRVSEEATLAQLKDLALEVAEKEHKVQSVLQHSGSRSTWYLDQLGTGLPGAIQFTQLQYQPLRRTIQEGKAVEVEPGTILIHGLSTSGEVFAQWLDQLEQHPEFLAVETLDYDYTAPNQSEFRIKIKTDDTQH